MNHDTKWWETRNSQHVHVHVAVGTSHETLGSGADGVSGRRAYNTFTSPDKAQGSRRGAERGVAGRLRAKYCIVYTY